MAAFLQSDGIPEAKWAATIERKTLVLDGLAMSYARVRSGDPAYLGGIRGWLQSIKKICDTIPN